MIEELNLTEKEKSILKSLKIGQTVFYTSRDKRNGEIDGREYHFRSPEFIKSLNKSDYIIASVRSDIQAIDVRDVKSLLSNNDIVFLEAFHSFISEIKKRKKLKKDSDFEIITIFLLPISLGELEEISKIVSESKENIIYNLMKQKLILRDQDPPKKIEERAKYAWKEIQDAKFYDYRIVCHFGEEDMRPWNEVYPEIVFILKQFIKIILNKPDIKKLVILSGPSCVGKGPLWKTFNKIR